MMGTDLGDFPSPTVAVCVRVCTWHGGQMWVVGHLLRRVRPVGEGGEPRPFSRVAP